MRAWIAILLACGGGQHGADPDDGDAARIICEAECHRDARCGNPPDCARCASLPVRTPPVWSTDWAREVAACFDRSACTHDAEEGCAVTSRHARAEQACLAARDRRCVILRGLSPDADARVTACYESHGDRCMPPFDWK